MSRLKRSISSLTRLSVFSALTGSIALLATETASAQAAGGQPPAWANIVPLVVVFGVFYFFLIRPQAKKQKEQQAFLSQLTRGEEVITSSGMLGRIEGLTDTFVTLEIAPDVRVRVLRTAVAGSAKAVTSPTASEAKT